MEPKPNGASFSESSNSDAGETFLPEKARVEQLSFLSSTPEHYYQAIKDIPILNKPQITELANQIQAGHEASETVMRSGLTPEQTMSLLAIVQLGERALWTLVYHNLRFAAYLAHRSVGGGKSKAVSGKLAKAPQNPNAPLPLEDRVQAANVGLIEAASRFNPSHVNEDGQLPDFVSYARRRIEGAIKDEIYDDMPHLSREVIQMGAAFRHEEERLAKEMRKVPSIEAVADRLEWSEADLKRLGMSGALINRLAFKTYGLKPAGGVKLGDPSDDFPDHEYEIADNFANHELAWKALALLDEPRQRQIITLHYGLIDEPMTFVEIAEVLGVSMQLVHQLEKKALATIRKKLIAAEGLPYEPGSLKKLKEAFGV